MKKETILENCQRILSFKKRSGGIPIITDESLPAIELLNNYEAILDVNGCPSRGVSVLYIKDEKEFEELKIVASEVDVETFKEHNNEMGGLDIESLGIPPDMYIKKFSFLYNGYYWEVENR